MIIKRNGFILFSYKAEFYTALCQQCINESNCYENCTHCEMFENAMDALDELAFYEKITRIYRAFEGPVRVITSNNGEEKRYELTNEGKLKLKP